MIMNEAIKRECRACGLKRQLKTNGRKVHYLWCPLCKNTEKITDEDYEGMDKQLKGKGRACPDCKNLMYAHGSRKGNKAYYCPCCKRFISSLRFNGVALGDEKTTGIHSTKKLRADNKTGFKGVHFYKKDGVFVASIRKYGKSHHIGRFNNAIDAAIAYNLKAKELYGPNAFQNDITQERNPADYEYGTKGPATHF